MGLFSRFHKNEQKNNSESVSLSPEEKFKKMVPANPGIIDMKLNADAVTLYTGSKTYIVFMTSEDVHRYKDLWETIQNLQRNGIDPKKLLR